MLEARIRSYLRNRNTPLNETLVEEFGEACKVALRRQLSPQKDREFSIRMSAIGKPVCQQQCEKLEVDGEPMEYNLPIKFLLGDLIEALGTVVLKSAGVVVDNEQLGVTYNGIPGTMDFTLDGAVYDIKSCSSYAFENKFSAGFHALRDSDEFGYVTQLYGYSEGSDLPAGGWVAVDKTTGQFAVCKLPLADNAYRKEALKKIQTNKEILENTHTLEDIQPQYQVEDELFYKKPTGKKVLARTCTYCKYKLQCFPSAEFKDNEKSKAQVKPKRWYV